MHFSTAFVQIVIALTATCCLAAPQSDKPENSRCMDSPRHKAVASPESSLHKTCADYEGLACCTSETTNRIHGEDLYKFQNVICKNKGLSPECKKYFLKDACFYECSPDIIPYTMNEDGKGDYLKNVPLCKSNCDNWFAACQNDFTCTKDWKKAMESDATCSDNDKCQTVKDKFQNAKNFCEKVWGNSYEVVDDGEKCLRFDNPEIRKAEDFTGGKQQANATDSDCHEGNTGSSSSPVKYNFILGVVPFVVGYHFLKSPVQVM